MSEAQVANLKEAIKVVLDRARFDDEGSEDFPYPSDELMRAREFLERWVSGNGGDVTALLKAEREKALREAGDRLGNMHDGFTYRPRDMKRHVLQMIEKDTTNG